MLSGLPGEDRLIGDNVDFSVSRAVGTVGGNDRLSGDPGNDALFGGPADDSLNGGVHTDTCDGEAGADAFAGCENVFGSP